jgi:hypothetical protein
MPEPPSGTVTFPCSDIEHSTRRLQHLGERYAEVLAEHRRLLREVFQRWDGTRSIRWETASSYPSSAPHTLWPRLWRCSARWRRIPGRKARQCMCA